MNCEKTLVLNLVGEPGCGKSSFCFWLMNELKSRGLSAEYVPEVVKYECYTDAGKQRVQSGDYDIEYLDRQMDLLEPLIGNVDVVVNDGCYEAFKLYGKKRMEEGSYQYLERLVDESVQRLNERANVHYIMPTRNHAYETSGRVHNEEQSQVIRQELIALFPTVNILLNDEEKHQLVDQIVLALKKNTPETVKPRKISV